MFARLFGETEELQIHNLSKKVALTGIGAVCSVVGMLLSVLTLDTIGGIALSIGGIVLFVAMFMWGFGAIKALFGIGSVGAIFSGNVVIGAVIFVVCLMVAYLISLIVALLGIGRFIYLKVKMAQERG